MGSKVAQILISALTLGFRSGTNTAVTTGNVKKGLIGGAVVALALIGTAAVDAYTSQISDTQVAAFKTECSKVTGNKVITHTDPTGVVVTKLECTKDVGQDDTVKEEATFATELVSYVTSLVN